MRRRILPLARAGAVATAAVMAVSGPWTLAHASPKTTHSGTQAGGGVRWPVGWDGRRAGHDFRSPQVKGRKGPPVVRARQGVPKAGEAAVTFKLLDRAGSPATAAQSRGVLLIPLDGSEWLHADNTNGQATATVPVGDYAISVYIDTPESGGRTSATEVYLPKVSFAKDTAMTLDARTARRVRVTTDGKGVGDADLIVSLVQKSARFPRGKAGVGTLDGTDVYLTPVPADSGLTLYVQGRATTKDNQYAYNLAGTSQGISASPGFHARTRDLAAVRTEYAGEGRPGCAGNRAGVDWGIGNIDSSFLPVGALPTVRTEYFTPGVTWNVDEGVTTPDCSFNQVTDVGRSDTFPRAGSYDREWNRGPYGPTGALLDLRDGWFVFRAGMLGQQDADSGPGPYPGVTGSSTLRDADGKVVLSSATPGSINTPYQLPQGKYELTVDTKGSAPWTDMATAQHVVWNFDVTKNLTPRLPSIRYRTSLDKENRARAGAAQTLTLVPDGFTTAGAGRTPQLWTSTDDGRTWQQAHVDQHGDTWTASIRNPASGYVSLRTSVAGAVDQTVIRAYGVG